MCCAKQAPSAPSLANFITTKTKAAISATVAAPNCSIVPKNMTAAPAGPALPRRTMRRLSATMSKQRLECEGRKYDAQIGRSACRERRVTVIVELGGDRHRTKKKIKDKITK